MGIRHLKLPATVHWGQLAGTKDARILQLPWKAARATADASARMAALGALAAKSVERAATWHASNTIW